MKYGEMLAVKIIDIDRLQYAHNYPVQGAELGSHVMLNIEDKLQPPL